MRILLLLFLLTLTGCASIYNDRLVKWKAKQFESPGDGTHLVIGWVHTDKTSAPATLGSDEDLNAEKECLHAVTHQKGQRIKLSNIGPAVAQCMQTSGWELKELGRIQGEF